MEVHRCRFVDYTPAAINAIAVAPDSTQKPYTACARANGEIELWNPQHNWHLERTIPGAKDASIEALAWTHQTQPTDVDMDSDDEENNNDDLPTSGSDKIGTRKPSNSSSSKLTAREKEIRYLTARPPRLFSAGLHAIVVEWDLNTLAPKKAVDSHGGAIWCMAASHDQTKIAVGCEDGCIRIFDVADDRFEFVKSLDKQKGRILSIAWDNTDKFIVTGSSESSLCRWDVATGRCVQRMVVERDTRGDPTLVWAVKVLKDGNIVSGDSLGHVKFWDVKAGVLKQSITKHFADVLSLAVSKDGRTVFSAGVDRIIMQYQLTETKKIQNNGRRAKNKNGTKDNRNSSTLQWVMSGKRRYHSHDVRAIALDESKNINALISGGLDVQLAVCPAAEFPALPQRRLPFFPHRPVVSYVKAKRWVMARYFDRIRVWKLGRGNLNACIERRDVDIVPLVEREQAILDVHLQGGHNTSAAEISPDGKWLAISDVNEIRLFRIEAPESALENCKVRKIKSFPTTLSLRGSAGGGAHQLKFTADSSKLIAATVESEIAVVDLSGWSPENVAYDFPVLKRFNLHRGINQGPNNTDRVSPITSLAVSADGQWLASGDLLNRIYVHNLDTLKFHFSTPKHSSQHICLSFHPTQPHLIVPLSSNEFYIYNVDTKSLTPWSKKNSANLPHKFLLLMDKITGVAINPSKPSSMILWGATFMCLIDLTKDVGSRSAIINRNKRKIIEKSKHRVHQDHLDRKRRAEAIVDATHQEFAELARGEGEEGETASKELANNVPTILSPGFLLLHKYQSVMMMDFGNDDALVIVERPWFDILAKMPPSFYKPRYGT